MMQLGYLSGYLNSSIQSEFGTPVSLGKQEMSRHHHNCEMLTVWPCLGYIIFLEKRSNRVNQEHTQMCFYRKCINKVLKSEKLMRFRPPLRGGLFRDLTFQLPTKSYQKTFHILPSSLLENTLCILDVTTALAKYSKYDKQVHLSSIFKIYKLYTFGDLIGVMNLFYLV